MYLFISVILMLSGFSSLYSGVLNHLKKVENKSKQHQMAGVDYIYMINLDQRPEKFARASKQLHNYGISPYRFSAVNGWELTMDTINDLGVRYFSGLKAGCMGTYYELTDKFRACHEEITRPGRVYFSHCMSRGAIGIVLSHLSVLNDAYHSGYNTVMVLEDDIEVVSDPSVIPELIKKLDHLTPKEGWDVLFLDRDTKDKNGRYVPAAGCPTRVGLDRPYAPYFAYNFSKDFRRIRSRFGAYSMIIRRSGMQKILNYFARYKIFLPYDIDFSLPKGIRFFTVKKDIIAHTKHEDTISDNGGPFYLKKKE